MGNERITSLSDLARSASEGSATLSPNLPRLRVGLVCFPKESVLHAVGAEADGDLGVFRALVAIFQGEGFGIRAVAGVAPAVGGLVVTQGQRHPTISFLRDHFGVCGFAILEGIVRGAA